MGNEIQRVEAHEIQVSEAREFSAPTLFKTDDPAEIVSRATKIADALNDVIQKKNLFKNMGTAKDPKNHVLVEAWTLCGAMLGVFPHIVWTREIAPGDWEARAEARTATGNVIASAEAMCTHDEPKWGTRPKYEWIGVYPNKVKTLVGEEQVASHARRSMAQTRAIGKVMRMPLGFIVSMAGYETTPAEEMSGDRVENQDEKAPKTKPAAVNTGPTPRQLMGYAAKQAETRTTIGAAVLLSLALEDCGFKTRDEVPTEDAATVIARIEAIDPATDAARIEAVTKRLADAGQPEIAMPSDDTGPDAPPADDGGKPASAATDAEIVSAIFEIRARVEKACGKEAARECMAVANNEAQIDRSVRLYLKKGESLGAGQRMVTRAELIQLHASLAEIADEKLAKVANA